MSESKDEIKKLQDELTTVKENHAKVVSLLKKSNDEKDAYRKHWEEEVLYSNKLEESLKACNEMAYRLNRSNVGVVFVDHTSVIKKR